MKRGVLCICVAMVCFVLGRLSLQLTATAQECAPVQVYTPPGGEPDVYVQDMDGDGEFNAITEAVYLLRWTFAGGPAPVRPCTGSSSGAGLPDTGQTTCYDVEGNVVNCTSDTCAGQDGFYQTGCPVEGRFVDNGDGTVTDTCTGLMWQKKTGNGGTELSWCNALAYCESLELAGHTDWRLPNVRELHSILDYGRHKPSIDPVFEALPDFYWSSSAAVHDTVYAWYVHFGYGYIGSYDEFYGLWVRAVRTAE